MAAIMMVPAVFLAALFSFVAVATWSANRRKERESLYHNETVRKLAETHGPQGVLEYVREVERLKGRRLGGGLILGGILSVFGGAAFMIFLYAMRDTREENIYFFGLIPIFVGLGILLHSRLFAQKSG